MTLNWRQQFVEPIYVLVWRELRIRYKRTALGFFWSLAPPAAQALIWLLIVEKIFGVDIPNYSAYLLCNLFTWQFIQNTLLDSCSVMLFHMPLVKAFPMRREILPASSVLSNLVHFFLSLLVLFVYLQILGVPIRPVWLLLPVILTGLIMLLLGLALALSCLTVFYHDIKFIMETFVLRLLFFFCPVVYFWLPERLHSVYLLNPLAVYLTGLREILLPPPQLPADLTKGNPILHLDWLQFVIALAMSGIVLTVGWAIFQRHRGRLAEWL